MQVHEDQFPQSCLTCRHTQIEISFTAISVSVTLYAGFNLLHRKSQNAGEKAFLKDYNMTPTEFEWKFEKNVYFQHQ